MNPMDIKRGIDAAVKEVVLQLEKMSRPVKTNDEVKNVAIIAANSDRAVGSLIAEAFERVGRDGTITVREGKTLTHELEVVDGVRLDRGYLSPYMVTDPKVGHADLANPYILFYEKKLSRVEDLLPILEQVVQKKKPLLIIAEDIESDVLSFLIINKVKNGFPLCAIKAPGFGELRKLFMQDLAIQTGGTLITDDEHSLKL